MTKKLSSKNAMPPGSSIALGIAIGIALGIAFHNLALGIALGVSIGSAFEIKNRKHEK